jgi:hypothetical protein
LGQSEEIIVYGITSNEIAITDAPTYKLSSGFACTERTMVLNSYITPSKASTNNLCTISKFFIEFTRVDDCAGNNPNEATTFIVSTSTSSTSLSYAFSIGGITTPQQAAGYWRVRYRPNIPNTQLHLLPTYKYKKIM